MYIYMYINIYIYIYIYKKIYKKIFQKNRIQLNVFKKISTLHVLLG